jgi:hypothetical protein
MKLFDNASDYRPFDFYLILPKYPELQVPKMEIARLLATVQVSRELLAKESGIIAEPTKTLDQSHSKMEGISPHIIIAGP